MADHDTTLGDHSELTRKLLLDVEAFIDEVGARNCTAHLQEVTRDGKFLKGRKLGQKPERFVEDHLIFPILETLSHSVLARPVQYAPRWTHGRGIPDFSLTTIPTATAKKHDIRLFGESKPPNKLHYARDDVKEYLRKDLDFDAIAVLTDGIQWELWVRPQNEPLAEDYEPARTASIQDVLGDVKARNLENESYHPHYARNNIDTDEFSEFTARAVVDTIRNELGVSADLENL